MLEINNIISKRELTDIIRVSSDEFKPPLNTLIKISDYCEKLLEKASIFVARENNIVVGLIAFYCNDQVQKQAYLSYLYVRTDKRRKKIGQTLLRKAILHSRECGMKSMKLETRRDNPSTFLYRINGFVNDTSQKTKNNGRIRMTTRF